MNAVQASAPGKAVLIGEYAVLSGAPALVMAVDRLARVRVCAGSEAMSRVEAPQLGLGPAWFRVDAAGGLCWAGGAADAASFARCRGVIDWFAECRPGQLAAAGPVVLSIDTSALYHDGLNGPVKLGLGSSAAMTVALAGALEAFCGLSGQAPADGLHRELLGPYRTGQAGQGSGIDLAAALHGGVSRYQLDDSRARVAAVSLPPDLQLAFFWTGQAASTGDFLQRYARWRGAEPASARAWLARLEDCAREALERIDRMDSHGFMTCINSYRQLMGRIGTAMGAPVLTRALDEMASVADRHGLACKPCGAGGGDLAFLAGVDGDAMVRAADSLLALGYQRLDLAVAEAGLRLVNEAA